jgi:hypothetical protein
LTEQEMRAKALELAVATRDEQAPRPDPRRFFERTEILYLYIRDGRDAVEGMLPK